MHTPSETRSSASGIRFHRNALVKAHRFTEKPNGVGFRLPAGRMVTESVC